LDLSVNASNKSVDELKEIISMAIQLGYDGIAFNHEVLTGRLSQNDVVSNVPVNFDDLSSVMLQLKMSGKTFQQFKRITMNIDEQNQLQTLHPSNPLLSDVDIIAIRPSDEKVFHQSLTNPNYDVVSFDLTQRLPFNLRPHTISLAIQQEIYFEICFSGLLKDNNSRRYVISNALSIIRATRGRNIIFSSGASDVMELRGPYDLANLGRTLFDFEFAKSKNSLSKLPRLVVKHGETRKTFRGVFGEIDFNSLEDKDKWKIPPSFDDSINF